MIEPPAPTLFRFSFQIVNRIFSRDQSAKTQRKSRQKKRSNDKINGKDLSKIGNVSDSRRFVFEKNKDDEMKISSSIKFLSVSRSFVKIKKVFTFESIESLNLFFLRPF